MRGFGLLARSARGREAPTLQVTQVVLVHAVVDDEHEVADDDVEGEAEVVDPGLRSPRPPLGDVEQVDPVPEHQGVAQDPLDEEGPGVAELLFGGVGPVELLGVLPDLDHVLAHPPDDQEGGDHGADDLDEPACAHVLVGVSADVAAEQAENDCGGDHSQAECLLARGWRPLALDRQGDLEGDDGQENDLEDVPPDRAAILQP